MALKKKKEKKTIVKKPNFWTICSRTWGEISTFWRPLTGVTVIYGAVYFALVLGFSWTYSYQDIADSVAAQIGDNSSWLAKNTLEVLNLFVYSNQSDAAASIIQFLLFVVATLAIIWVLRQLRTLKHIRMRDAYFEGTARMVPTILVIILLVLTFIPAVIGSAIFSVAQVGSGIEIAVGSIVTGLLMLGSIYWFCMWLPAIYIVSLPKGTPISAIKSSNKLTKGNRLWMVRNILLFAVCAIIFAYLAVLLFVQILPIAAVFIAYIVSFILFELAQVYIFTIYRGLLDES